MNLHADEIFTYGYGSGGLPPFTTSPLDPLTAGALREAYDLAIAVSCTPRALAVCSVVLKKSVADYVPGDMRSSLGIPLHSVAPPNVASAVTAWYRTRPVQVVVDINSTIYDQEKYFPDASTIYVSGEIAAGLSAAYELKSANPELWRRHLLLSAIVIAREMFCNLRYSTHCRMVPVHLARSTPSTLWSYTSGHHAPPMRIRGQLHIPGHAGWWWEDKVIGGSIEGLLYLPQDAVPDHPAMRSISVSIDTLSLVPVALIKTLALRSGIIPGLWGEISRDMIDALCDGPLAYLLPLPRAITPHQERTYPLPPHLQRGGDMVPINIRRRCEDRSELLEFWRHYLPGQGEGSR